MALPIRVYPAVLNRRLPIPMTSHQIYDPTPDGTAQRQWSALRHADVERDEAAARRAHIAQRNALEELWHEVVAAHATTAH